MVVLDDDKNLDKKVEKRFLENKLFLIPLYAYIVAMFLTHLWCLALFSTKYKPNHWIFEKKPETFLEYVIFGFVISFFGSLSSLAGHELVHHKEWYNKLVGNIPYTEAFYSHFWDEHTKGHHKDIATPLDPVCHDVGVDCYTGLVKAVYGTHVKTWQRENARLLTKYGTK